MNTFSTVAALQVDEFLKRGVIMNGYQLSQEPPSQISLGFPFGKLKNERR